ncbi:MAG: metal-dependent hydrolase, partial [Candidatus Thermoplasmatota archaeon]|nr:metal-dependent hydrolase [Candidatus Thermoplasmatota archaeon]
MDPFAHITIPLLILLALRIQTRKVLLMLPFAVIMDVDFLFAGSHRMFLHNMFLAILIPLIILVLIHRYRPEYRDYGYIAFFFLISHFILDLGKGMTIFYPLSTDFYYFEWQLFFSFIGPIPVPNPQLDYGVIVAEDTAIVG